MNFSPYRHWCPDAARVKVAAAALVYDTHQQLADAGARLTRGVKLHLRTMADSGGSLATWYRIRLDSRRGSDHARTRIRASGHR